MFCPKCRTEYRPGFTMCADCGLTLVATLPPEPVEEHRESSTLVTVFESFSLPEIAIVKSILEDEGIECFSNDYGDGAFWGHAGHAIKVSEMDAARARELLAEFERGTQIKEESALEEEGDSRDAGQV
jgi:hypothetical protein